MKEELQILLNRLEDLKKENQKERIKIDSTKKIEKNNKK